VANGTYNYYVLGDGLGTHVYNGTNYYTLDDYNTGAGSSWLITHGTFAVTGADFATGTVDGYVQQFMSSRARRMDSRRLRPHDSRRVPPPQDRRNSNRVPAGTTLFFGKESRPRSAGFPLFFSFAASRLRGAVLFGSE